MVWLVQTGRENDSTYFMYSHNKHAYTQSMGNYTFLFWGSGITGTGRSSTPFLQSIQFGFPCAQLARQKNLVRNLFPEAQQSKVIQHLPCPFDLNWMMLYLM